MVHPQLSIIDSRHEMWVTRVNEAQWSTENWTRRLHRRWRGYLTTGTMMWVTRAELRDQTIGKTMNIRRMVDTKNTEYSLCMLS